MKKLLSIVLCILMVMTTLLVSCGREEPEESKQESSVSADGESSEVTGEPDESSEASQENPYMDEEGKYVKKNMLDFNDDWRDYGEFRVLVYNKNKQDTYFSEEIEAPYDTTDAKLKDSVDTRNKWIEETYGIKIKAVAVDDVTEAFNKELQAELNSFDVAMPFMSACATLAKDGKLLDLREFSDYIDLDAPWWDQNATNSLSINDRVFFTTGDISIMQRIVSGGIAFNRDLMEASFAGVDMYELVDTGKWTLDKMYSMCKEFTRQGDDNEKMDENDIWGCMGGGIGYYFAAGETLTSKDNMDIPKMYIGTNDRSFTVAQKVLELLDEKGTWYVTVNEFTDQTNKWAKTVEIFGTDKALFMIFAFSAIKKFRAYPVKFGIVPYPKFNEDQDDYFINCAANYAYGICIPSFSPDPEFCAYMIELLAIGGKNHITNAYYTSILKSKDLATDDDERMLDLIFSNIVYDVATVYGFSGLNQVFEKTTHSNLKSYLDEITPSVVSAIDGIVEAYQD